MTQHPQSATLVVEVAISSVGLDRENASMYAQAGVNEYWIVLPKQKKIEIYSEPEGTRYLKQSEIEGDALLHSLGIPGLSVRFSEIWPHT